MDKEKRYQIVTYCYDCGSDDKLEYKTIKEAIKEAKKYLSDGYDKALEDVQGIIRKYNLGGGKELKPATKFVCES